MTRSAALFVRPFAALLAGVALLPSCDKPEATPAPTPAPAPVSSLPAASPPSATASASTAPAAPALAPAEAAAVDSFRAEMRNLKAFIEANQQSKDAKTGLASLRELIQRAEAIPTAGLPADLAAAWTAMTDSLARVGKTVDSLPVPLDELEAYGQAAKRKGPDAEASLAAEMARFTNEMKAHEDESEAASAKLKEIATKYGVESLDLTGK